MYVPLKYPAVLAIASFKIAANTQYITRASVALSKARAYSKHMIDGENESEGGREEGESERCRERELSHNVYSTK